MPKTIRTKAVGVTKGNRQETIEYLSPGDTLDLRREPDNPYDENAIRIYDGTYSDDDIGYLSRDLAAEIAPIMDSNRQLVMADVIDVTGQDKETQGVNILITIYSEEETEELYRETREKYAAKKPDPVIRQESSISPEPAIKFEPSFTRPHGETIRKPAKPNKMLVKSDKNIVVVLILWFFIGPLGGHRAFVGRWSWLYALTLGYFGFGWLYDLVLIIFKSYKDKNGRVVWF